MKKIFLITACFLGCALSCQAIVTEQLENAKDEIQEIKADLKSVNSRCGSCRGCKSKCKSVDCSKW